MISVADILKRKREQEKSLADPRLLLHFFNRLPAYGTVQEIRRLAYWLGPFQKVRIEGKRVPLFLNWKTLLLAELLDCTQDQVVALMLDEERRIKDDT